MEQEILITLLFNLASGKWYWTFLQNMLTITLGTELRPALQSATKTVDKPARNTAGKPSIY